jgi:uncharacterized repeat protein (TIGR01451 family)
MYSTLRYSALMCLFCASMSGLFAQSDLSLSLQVTNENAPIFESVVYRLTVTNAGPQTATNVIVKAPTAQLTAAYGLVFNTATTASGSYDVIFNAWRLSNLPSGATATLELSLFTLKAERPAFFAEIVAADQSDPDSDPDNGDASFGVREDDEVYRPAPSADCNLVATVESDTCFQPIDQVSTYGFKLKISTTNPTVQLIEVSNNSNFIGTTIIPANTVYAPFDEWFLLGAGQVSTYFFRPFGTQGCVGSFQVTAPGDCLEPAPPGDCLLPYFFPDVFCTNNNQNLAMRFSMLTASLFTQSLAPTDAFRVLLNGTEIGTGVVQNTLYLGLSGQPLELTDALVDLRIERISDEACIAQYEFKPTDYCVAANSAFCQQEGIFPWEEWIKRVQFGNLDNPSGKSTSTNYTFSNPGDPSTSATVIAGDSTAFIITVGYNYLTYNDYITMFLDTDRNGTFSQDEEIYNGQVPTVASGFGAQAILTAKAFIPADAQNGASTLKIVLRRGGPAAVCGSVPYGEVELYNVRIGGGVNSGGCSNQTLQILSVECDDNGTPSSAADDQYYINYQFNFPGYEGTSTFAGSYWIQPNGYYSSPPVPLNFEVEGRVGEPSRYGPIPISDFPKLNFRVLGGFCNSDYVLIQAPASTCSNAPFNPLVNCSASSNFPWEDWISRVKVRDFTQNSAKSTYGDYTAQTVNLLPGSNPFSLRAAFSYLSYEEYVRVWVDFDQDGLLEDTEIAYQGVIARGANGVPFRDLNGLLVVPGTALPGETLMRVRMARGGYANACDAQGFGEVEDYTVNIAIGLGLQSGNVQQLHVPITVTEQGFYPNPASDAVYLQLEPNQSAQVTIMNQLGQVVMQKELVKTLATEQINTQELMNGHYLLRIEVAGQRARTHGLVIAKGY